MYPAQSNFNISGNLPAWWREATTEGEYIHAGEGRGIAHDVQSAIVAKMTRFTTYAFPRSAGRPFSEITRPGDPTTGAPGVATFVLDSTFGPQTTAMLWNLAGGNLSGVAPRFPRYAAAAERDLQAGSISRDTMAFALWLAYGNEAPAARRHADLTSPDQIAISPDAVMPAWERTAPGETRPGYMTRELLVVGHVDPLPTDAGGEPAGSPPAQQLAPQQAPSSMSTGAAIAIGVGATFGLGGLVGLAVWVAKRKRRKR